MVEEAPNSRSRYRVITTLGQGGMARVLLTLSRGPAGVDKLLVVKELKEDLKGDPEFLTMFLDEARIAARLNHPNVIQTYEVATDGDHPVIVMEYLEGQSLGALLARVGRANMPLELHVFILAQTAAGLHYAHEVRGFDGQPLGLVHRDVSPHNVFVTYDGQVKLVDFGIAKAADSANLTRSGQFKGKIGYAAPEQVSFGIPVDRRADVFALGVMLWEAITGRRLTAGETEQSMIVRRQMGKDPSIDEAAPGAPEELRRICGRAMASDPAARYATAAELRADLEAWLDMSRRVNGEALGAFVRSAFSQDREKVQALIQQRIRELASGAPDDISGSFPRLVPPAPTSQPTARSISIVTSPSPGADPHEASTRVTSAAPLPAPPPPPRSRGILLLSAGIVVAAVAAAILLLRSSNAAAPAASASTAAQAAVATTVDVWIKADPGDATLALDGVPLAGNPFHGAMPKAALTRTLRITAPGHTPEERMIVLDHDLHLELVLKRAEAAAPGSAATATAAPPAGPLPRAAASPAPGDKRPPRPGQKKSRTIDDTF